MIITLPFIFKINFFLSFSFSVHIIVLSLDYGLIKLMKSFKIIQDTVKSTLIILNYGDIIFLIIPQA